jgi:pseudaminic acid biosynthesis-associated methylase
MARDDIRDLNHRAPLAAWEGEFGRAYTDRNAIAPEVIVPAFQTMLAGLDLRRVLEVGCNRGHNLLAIEKVLPKPAELTGIEPNPHALEIARRAATSATFMRGTAYDLPFPDEHFDLVFTAGVLIHIPPAELPQALTEIHRVSRRYLLALEYHADRETPVPYRGHDGLLWKRDFLRAYQESFPGLSLRRQGFWARGGGFDGWFDDLTWWLLEKPARP